MRKNNYDALLFTSIAILIVSAVLLAITGYSLYFRHRGEATIIQKAASGPEVATKDWVRDSLQQVYNNTVKTIDQQFTLAAQNASGQSDTAYMEMSQLKKEIADLLRDQGSEKNLLAAREKIEELQLKVVKLQQGYSSIESENRKLQKLLERLMATANNSSVSGAISSQTAIKVTEKSTTPEKTINPSVAGLYLFAVAGDKNSEKETSAEDAEKIVGSFTIKNWPSSMRSDIMIVLLQPDGRVVKTAWDSGSFETPNGRKVYSIKLNAEQVSPEKPLNFTLTPEHIYKGTYIMQLWHKGNIIGRLSRTMT
ncbi:MAG: hypothetical protein ABIT96_05430 [Ferruginibacter sp.]